jgi:hypothetical protein
MKRLLDLTSRNIDVGQVAQHLLLRYRRVSCFALLETPSIIERQDMAFA